MQYCSRLGGDYGGRFVSDAKPSIRLLTPKEDGLLEMKCDIVRAEESGPNQRRRRMPAGLLLAQS